MSDQNEDRCRWMEYEGARILFTDFRGLKPEGYLPVIDRAIDMIRKEPPLSVFTLSAHSLIHINDKLTVKTEEYKKAAEGISKGTATFGLEGIQKVIAKSVKRDVYFAKTMEEALAWIKERNDKAS